MQVLGGLATSCRVAQFDRHCAVGYFSINVRIYDSGRIVLTSALKLVCFGIGFVLDHVECYISIRRTWREIYMTTGHACEV